MAEERRIAAILEIVMGSWPQITLLKSEKAGGATASGAVSHTVRKTKVDHHRSSTEPIAGALSHNTEPRPRDSNRNRCSEEDSKPAKGPLAVTRETELVTDKSGRDSVIILKNGQRAYVRRRP
jgi:hypothetical protein